MVGNGRGKNGDGLSKSRSGTRTRFDLLDGPAGVFGNQRFGIMTGAGQGGQGGGVADISQGDADVAQQAAAFGAKDGRAVKAVFEAGVVEGQQLKQVRRAEVGPGVGSHEAAFAGETVPGTNRQAIVAAVNAVADGGAEFDGDGALEFDGEIGNAAAGIELEGRGDGVGGAGG